MPLLELELYKDFLESKERLRSPAPPNPEITELAGVSDHSNNQENISES